MEPYVTLITLGVTDLQRAIRFYRDGLGLPVREENENIAFFQLRGVWLSLFSREALAADAGVPDPNGPGNFAGFTLAHNLDSTEAVDALIAHAVTVGATLVKPAEPTFWGGYSGYFADPDGYLWEIAWNPHFTVS
jgi:catechol 2,3-dioxygenase-like lactoylglutathione lyase family enzyme